MKYIVLFCSAFSLAIHAETLDCQILKREGNRMVVITQKKMEFTADQPKHMIDVFSDSSSQLVLQVIKYTNVPDISFFWKLSDTSGERLAQSSFNVVAIKGQSYRMAFDHTSIVESGERTVFVAKCDYLDL